MEIYAPIAHRLGMQKIKWELEDLSLKYLDPIGYEEIADELAAQSRGACGVSWTAVQEQIIQRLDEDGHREHRLRPGEAPLQHLPQDVRPGQDHGRGLRPLRLPGAWWTTVADCYNVLGVIHDLYKPVLGRFKDYIATPKPNMYQSLHTTVIGEDGHPLRGADPHLGDARHRRVRRGRPLEVQAGHGQRQAGQRGGLRVDPHACWRTRRTPTPRTLSTA